MIMKIVITIIILTYLRNMCYCEPPCHLMMAYTKKSKIPEFLIEQLRVLVENLVLSVINLKYRSIFLSKSSNFYLVRIMFKFCLPVAQTLIKELLRNYKWYFRLPMSAFATAIWNTLSKHQLLTLNFAFKLFHVSIANDNCRSQKYHL